MELPVRFQEKMQGLLGEEYPSYENSFSEPRASGLRVNRAKLSPSEFLKITPFTLRPVPWAEDGFYYMTEEPVAKHPHYYAGLYYIQEPTAMIPASRLPIREGDRVLDLCAAPGGKATALAAKLNGTGLLAANDISRSRAMALLKNLELSGAGNILVTSETPEKLAGHFGGYFHKILVDAPCSGEGMFRRDPSMVKSWEEHGPEYYVPIQREILERAVEMLLPGGSLLYSTCTFDKEENEGNLAWLMERHPEMSLVPIEGSPGLSEGFLPGTLRAWPHKTEGEGHFAALLEKSCHRESIRHRNVPDENGEEGAKALPEELREFLAEVSREVFDGKKVEIRGGKAYALPKDFPDVRGLSILRTGLYLGDVKKNRFEPSQALAMYLSKEHFGNVCDLPSTDERIFRYLKGETLNAPEYKGKGWTLVCTDGFPLGWAKADSGTLKNKYCAGWRMQ